MRTEGGEIFSFVEELYRLGIKRPGTEAGIAAEEYLIKKLASFGLEVTMDGIPLGVFSYERAALEVRGAATNLYPYIPSAYTGGGGIKARILPVEWTEHGFSAGGDPRGNILISNIPYGRFDYNLLLSAAIDYHDPDGDLGGYVQDITWNTDAEVRFLNAAEEAGAAGVIGVYPELAGWRKPGGTEIPPGLLFGGKEQGVTPFLFNPVGDIRAGTPGPVPAAGMGPVHGGALLEAAGREAMEGTFILDGTRRMGVTRNIIADIPGSTERFIIVACHHDTMWSGAVEDCSGCAVVLSLAEHFAKSRIRPPLGIKIIFFAAEQYRDLGVRQYVAKRLPELQKNLVCDIHIEHIGKEAVIGADGDITATERIQPRAFFVTPGLGLDGCVIKTMKGHDMRRTVVLPTTTPLGVPTDACPFNEAGLPVVSFISAPLYWNAAEDTLDMVPGEELTRVRDAMKELVESVMNEKSAPDGRRRNEEDYG